MTTRESSKEAVYTAVGRRKSAIARVRLTAGTGTIVVNGKPLEEAFPMEGLQRVILEPFKAGTGAPKLNAMVKVTGGGVAGQAGAVRHAIARAMVAMDEKMRPLMRKDGLLTRDARVKERKKYGLKRARKAPQYTKR